MIQIYFRDIIIYGPDKYFFRKEDTCLVLNFQMIISGTK